MPEGGVTAKLRGSLESYLARSAAELDERGAGWPSERPSSRQ
jgi:hypothetical protein